MVRLPEEQGLLQQPLHGAVVVPRLGLWDSAGTLRREQTPQGTRGAGSHLLGCDKDKPGL